VKQIESTQGRAVVHDLGGTLRIVIPAKTHPLAISYLCMWLVFWFCMGATGAWVQVNGGLSDPIFLVFWLAVWMAGGSMAVSMVVWKLAGREVIEVSMGTLTLQKRALCIGRSRSYALSDARNFRVRVDNPSFFAWLYWWYGDLWGFGRGQLAFDYGMKTIRFASEIDEAEGRHILGLFQQKGVRFQRSGGPGR